MSHHIYKTDAIVVRAYDRGESHKTLALFSEEFGMLYASVQSVREERSRLRYSLEPMTECSVSLVRGKNGWRVTGASAREMWYYTLQRNNTQQNAGRALALLARLLPEEGSEKGVYDIVRDFLQKLACAKDWEEARTLEEVLVSSVLRELGYLPSAEVLPSAQNGVFSPETLRYARERRGVLLKNIQSGINAAQL